MTHCAKSIPAVALVAAAFATALTSRAAAPAGRYVISNGTVGDEKTGLVWQQATSPSQYTQAGASAYCTSLNLAGGTWRLPTLKELVTIVDFSVPSPGPTVDATAFPATPASGFWSSTPYGGGSADGWLVLFTAGYTTDAAVATMEWARCVR